MFLRVLWFLAPILLVGGAGAALLYAIISTAYMR
jgi:hypothetical protein